MQEQQEEVISELIGLPTQWAVLKTKGKEPTLFRTYDLPESDLLDVNLENLRLISHANGYTASLRELDEALMLNCTRPKTLDEPMQFVE